MSNYYLRGAWNAVCDLCGREYKSTELQRNWKGQMVCSADYETRHPQDFVRGVPESTGLPWSRPPVAEEIFIGICTPNGQTAIVDFGVVDCVRVDYISPFFDPTITS